MRKLALFLLLTLPTFAQQGNTIPATANLTASDAGTCATAGACLVVNISNNAASSVVQLTGTWSATVQFEATSKNGGTFVAINAVPLGSTTAVTSATANGAWRIAISGVAQLRVRCSAFTSGTIAVAITSSTGSSAQSNGGGGGGGGINPPAGDIGGTAGSPTVVGLESLALPTLAASTGCLFDNAGTLQLVTGCNLISTVASYFTTTGGVLQLGGQSSQSGAFDSLAPTAGSGKGDLMVSNSSQVWVDFTHNTTGTAYLQEDNTGIASWVSIAGFADTALDNLASVAINTSLLPGVTATSDLGSSSFAWRNIYLSGSITNTSVSPWIWRGIEGSCSGAAASYDVLCIGNSSLHSVMESDNNGTFYQLVKGISPMTAFGIPYSGGDGMPLTTLSPPAIQGQYQMLYLPTTSSAVAPTINQVGLAPRGIVGATTTDTVLYSDNNSVITHTHAASGTLGQTLPTPTTLNNANFFYKYCNDSPQTDTITPTTWTIQAGNAAAGASLSVAPGACYFIHIDPTAASTNWLADISQAGGGGTPCTTTALSFQFNNAGAFGCAADFTLVSSHTLTMGASGLMDLSAGASGAFKVPVAAGATSASNGSIDYDSTNGNTHIRTNGADSIAAAEAAALAAGYFPKQTDATHGLLAQSLCDEAITTANVMTCTDTGGIASPKFTSTGTTAGFIDFPQGTTSAAVAPCNVATSICEQAPTAVTSYLITKPGAAPNISSYKQTDGCGSSSCTESFHPVPVLLTVASDFTDSTSTTLQLITGLSTTMPVSKAVVVSFHCGILFDQATSVVSDSFGVGITGTAPTQANAGGNVFITASTVTAGTLTALASTTPTAIVTFTPGVATTIYRAELDGTVEQPSNATPGVLGIYVSTSTGTDNFIVKRGSYCSVIYQ